MGESLPYPLNGTMILARSQILIKITVLKHFSLEVWVIRFRYFDTIHDVVEKQCLSCDLAPGSEIM